jgi:2-polyprenyl-3-methyl-5-hydroxy-6-metoxy-1,4-benzoquinol methylase
MTQTTQKHEYYYGDSNLTNAHSFLISPLRSLLPKSNCSSGEKLRVLDLGCGNGSLSHLIAEQGYEVTGIEQSEQGITIARRNFPNCHFIQASIYNLPFAELQRPFDIILSVEVIEHLLYPRELVRAAKKLLKPNGRLIMTTPYHGYCKNLVIALLGKWTNTLLFFGMVVTLNSFLSKL